MDTFLSQQHINVILIPGNPRKQQTFVHMTVISEKWIILFLLLTVLHRVSCIWVENSADIKTCSETKVVRNSTAAAPPTWNLITELTLTSFPVNAFPRCVRKDRKMNTDNLICTSQDLNIKIKVISVSDGTISSAGTLCNWQTQQCSRNKERKHGNISPLGAFCSSTGAAN